MTRIRQLSATTMSLTLTACSSGYEGMWEADRVEINGEDVTDEYVYTDVDGDCEYGYGFSLMITEGLRGFFGNSSHYDCGDGMDYAMGYGWWLDFERDGGGITATFYDDYEFSCGLSVGRLNCTLDMGRESMDLRFRKD